MKLFITDRKDLTTTVEELIAELSKFDPKAYVFTEGCDCIGNVVKITDEGNGSILICRDDRAFTGYGENRKLNEKYIERVQR